ncbi:MAG: hypothetical protein FJ088_03020, partial [Deltaproteobacteria bacterium]|nr:hypothetical protein [Deltaproteobacteria bacterium]
KNLRNQIFGIDKVKCIGVTTVRETLVFASVQPDEDFRNMNRFAYDGKRKPILDEDGGHVTRDPMILNMGNSEGLSSQAHAHYFLPPLGLASEIRLLITNPARFIIPAGFGDTVETYGSDMAEMHAALAIIAASARFKGSEYLKYLFMGQAMHYMEDLSLPLHTVQIGTSSFVFRALFNYFIRATATFGGVFGEMLSFGEYGINLIKNYHLISEEYIGKHIGKLSAKPDKEGKKETKGNQEIFGKNDQDILRWIEWQDKEYLDSKGGYIKGLAEKTAFLSSYEGEALYKLAYKLFCPELRSYDTGLEDGEFEMDQYDCFSDDPERLKIFNAVIVNSFKRAATSVRLLKEHVEGKTGGRLNNSYVETLNRLVRNRLDHLDAADARLSLYLQTGGAASKSAGHVNIIWFITQTAFALIVISGIFLASRAIVNSIRAK